MHALRFRALIFGEPPSTLALLRDRPWTILGWAVPVRCLFPGAAPSRGPLDPARGAVSRGFSGDPASSVPRLGCGGRWGGSPWTPPPVQGGPHSRRGGSGEQTPGGLHPLRPHPRLPSACPLRFPWSRRTPCRRAGATASGIVTAQPRRHRSVAPSPHLAAIEPGPAPLQGRETPDPLSRDVSVIRPTPGIPAARRPNSRGFPVFSHPATSG